jgi:hypothetical protein
MASIILNLNIFKSKTLSKSKTAVVHFLLLSLFLCHFEAKAALACKDIFFAESQKVSPFFNGQLTHIEQQEAATHIAYFRDYLIQARNALSPKMQESLDAAILAIKNGEDVIVEADWLHGKTWRGKPSGLREEENGVVSVQVVKNVNPLALDFAMPFKLTRVPILAADAKLIAEEVAKHLSEARATLSPARQENLDFLMLAMKSGEEVMMRPNSGGAVKVRIDAIGTNYGSIFVTVVSEEYPTIRPFSSATFTRIPAR